ncbi:MAG: cysteine methyltransferase, partial [Bacteroidales bacterium]|nr:cysteine methyltransferase [Bacteroidales bacterium]
MFLFYEYSSPVGRLLLGELRGSIVLCDWTESHRHPAHLRRLGIEKPLLSENPTSLLQEAVLQLDQYFSAQRTTFTLP